MMFTTKWYVPNRVIFLKIEDVITVADIEVISNQLIEMLNDRTAPIHCIVHMTFVGEVSLNALQFRRNFRAIDHPSFGWLMTVGNLSPIMSYVLPTAALIAKVKFLRFKLLTDAIIFLSQQDPSINWDEEDLCSSS